MMGNNWSHALLLMHPLGILEPISWLASGVELRSTWLRSPRSKQHPTMTTYASYRRTLPQRSTMASTSKMLEHGAESRRPTSWRSASQIKLSERGILMLQNCHHTLDIAENMSLKVASQRKSSEHGILTKHPHHTLDIDIIWPWKLQPPHKSQRHIVFPKEIIFALRIGPLTSMSVQESKHPSKP